MKLSDSLIRDRIDRKDESRILIDPYPKDHHIQPTSVDLHLSSMFRFYDNNTFELDPMKKPRTIIHMLELYLLFPNQFLLGSTIERIEVPTDLVAILEGKSSLGRLGLAVHITAGFIDPGFKGNITLELKNMNKYPIKLRSGMAVCQICFEPIMGKVLRPYGSNGLGSRYSDSKGTIGARPPVIKE